MNRIVSRLKKLAEAASISKYKGYFSDKGGEIQTELNDDHGVTESIPTAYFQLKRKNETEEQWETVQDAFCDLSEDELIAMVGKYDVKEALSAVCDAAINENRIYACVSTDDNSIDLTFSAR